MITDKKLSHIVSAIDLGHFRTLRYLDECFCISGWEEWGAHNDALKELEEWGLVIGKWGGSLDYRPYPVWTITKEGKKALQLYQQRQQQTMENKP